VPFSNLHVLVDSFREVAETNEENNGAQIPRMEILPVTFGFPFGFSVLFPPNLPLPTKIVTQVLDPIDPAAIAAELGADSGADVVAHVDELVRSRMQEALDGLARERRFPVLG